MRDRFAGLPAIRSPAEITITVPIPGLWLSQQAASQNGASPAATELLPDDQRERRMGGRWRSDRAADAG
jgi:hypothetical protein